MSEKTEAHWFDDRGWCSRCERFDVDIIGDLENQNNALTSERDEAVRVAGELRAKAAIADQIFASGYMDWYTEEGTQNNVECRFCGDAGLTSEFIVHADHCPKVAYDSLTASTGGSSDEPQKEIRE